MDNVPLIKRILVDLAKRKVYVKSLKPPAGTPIFRGKQGSYFWYAQSIPQMRSSRADEVKQDQAPPVQKVSTAPIKVGKPSALASSQCMSCARYTDQGCCEAYPDGIPDVIVQGFVDHHYPYDGDGGMVWKAKEDLGEEE